MSDILTGPGGFFELTDAEVLGVTMPVLKDRLPSVRTLTDNAATNFGAAEFVVVDDGRRFSFTDHRNHAAAIADMLATEHGVAKGDRIVIFGANAPEWLFAFSAITALGAIAVAFNGWWTTDEAEHALALTEPSIIIGDARRLERLTVAAEGPPVVTFDDLAAHVAGLTAPESIALPSTPIDEDDPALIFFTSGTTGRPKGAVLSHRTIVGFPDALRLFGAEMLMASGADIPAPPVALVASPLFHVSGLFAHVIQALVGGYKTVWTTGRFDPETVIRVTKEEGVTAWAGSGTQIYRLLEHPALATLDTTQLVRVSVGGSPTTPEMIRLQTEKLPHLAGRASSGYGSTETGGIVSVAVGPELAAAANCVGRPLTTISVKIADDDGAELPDGEVGRVCVRSPLVMQGYWNDAEATAAAFLPDRWMITGDIGYMLAGRLHIAARDRDLIIRGGENIHPTEIEMRIEEHPAVHEVAVFGVDDLEYGQRSKAVIRLKPNAEASVDVAALQAFVGETLASYKVPDLIEFTADELPRNATGKVLKDALRSGTAPPQVEPET